VAKTILVQLELMGQIQALTPVYSEAKFKYIKNQSDIIKMFPPEKQTFLKIFFSYVLEKKVWNYIDIDDMTTKMKIERRLVIDTLDFLSGHCLIDLRQSGLVNRFRFINKNETLQNEEELIKEICETTQSRLQKQIDRIGEFVGFFTKEWCIHSSIASYFETPLTKACGHCSYCENGGSISLAKSEYNVETFILNLGEVKRTIIEHPHIVKSSSRITKFLLGIKTPYLTKSKLVKNKYFSYYEGKSWKQVNNYVIENF
jgi:ATP-dependent DNA helicase RecQ